MERSFSQIDIFILNSLQNDPVFLGLCIKSDPDIGHTVDVAPLWL